MKLVFNKDQNQDNYNILLEKCSYQLAKNNDKMFFDSIIMMRFGETKVPKEKFYSAKKPVDIWNFVVNNIVISKLFKKNNNSKYFIGYLDKV